MSVLGPKTARLFLNFYKSPKKRGGKTRHFSKKVPMQLIGFFSLEVMNFAIAHLMGFFQVSSRARPQKEAFSADLMTSRGPFFVKLIIEPS